MRLYYFIIFTSTLLFVLSACKPEELVEIADAAHACYLENANTGQRLCLEIRSATVTKEEIETTCESLGSDPTGHIYEDGKCATSAAVIGHCRAVGSDAISTIYFYYPEYDESGAQEYCDNLGSPYSWGQEDSAISLIHGIHAEEELEDSVSFEDLVNDQVIKFP